MASGGKTFEKPEDKGKGKNWVVGRKGHVFICFSPEKVGPAKWLTG